MSNSEQSVEKPNVKDAQQVSDNNAAMNNVGFAEQITVYKSQIENYLEQHLATANIDEPTLKAAMHYSLLLGGKRLRPFLVYATGEIFNADPNSLNVVAAALESIHSYSLIHDDLPAMDDDDLRRGQLTCHKKYNDAVAILAGDTLQTFAFQMLSGPELSSVTPERQLQLIHLISQASIDMCAGQSIDLIETDANTDLLPEIKLTNLQHMHKLKTGALIKASVLAGALCGKVSEQELNYLEQYADAIGLAFQVWDDVLDIVSDTETLGKPQGSDLEANKSTYPALLGLEQAKLKAKNLVDEAVQALQQLPYNTSVLQQLALYIIERDH
ncbi:(2E,6E)-farnesyl diphosphate synthase [Psychrosphaera sp. 1_MG-2023]|uniref:(2E,6E)-farnesyl diphosphate synthase n=1 Tax=Psychrosphaera sp. 1_MG-2023 TaxID=3062643 RepID=UPI0026E1D098|nr:farnesyl diphosphate synthase [Psychrosphaera sp. 1_MG-2023]MDO6721419.1 (2E,6E)-farnesyl diphosphate synthase [Psychrosphaera sp. 1_MG-2023]